MIIATQEWTKACFEELVTELKSYQTNLAQWMAASTKQMVDNADRCTALETKVSELGSKVADNADQCTALETKVSELESKMAELYTVISETDATAIVDNNWQSSATASIATTSEEA